MGNNGIKSAILLSGGMDSIALAYWKRPDIAFTIDYGQLPAETEIRISAIISELLGIEHHIIKIDCSSLGSGDLINVTAIDNSPSTEWWPYRNQLLVTLAGMKAISIGVKRIMLASVKTDSFHKDGTSEFYKRVNELMVYQEGQIEVLCPSTHLTTVELIKESKVPKELLFWAHSCHRSTIACGNCRGCNKYYNVVRELGYI